MSWLLSRRHGFEGDGNRQNVCVATEAIYKAERRRPSRWAWALPPFLGKLELDRQVETI